MDWPLFGAAFLSATLLPGGSELLLLARVGDGTAPWAAVITATAGNTLGSALTFAMGSAGLTVLQRRWLRISTPTRQRAEARLRRIGWPALLFAWLPVVGDALCLAAGALRFPLPAFLLLVATGKAARYAVLAAAAAA